MWAANCTEARREKLHLNLDKSYLDTFIVKKYVKRNRESEEKYQKQKGYNLEVDCVVYNTTRDFLPQKANNR